MTTPRRLIIGFDRKVQLNWLDATAHWAAQGLSLADIRQRLNRLLGGAVAGDGTHSARGKTITVLLHVWVQVPSCLIPLRDDGLAMLPGRSAPKRLPLHWGMCMASYPYFREVAATTGRLLSLQGTAALSQITRRMAESWGERNTVTRTVRQVVRTFVLWDVLRDTGEPGVYSAGRQVEVAAEDRLGPWLLEAAISNCGRPARPLRGLVAAAAFFPFRLNPSAHQVANSPRLELYRQGLDEDVVILKQN